MSLCMRMSRWQRPAQRSTAAGSRCAMSASHVVQDRSLCAALTAMKSAKSSSQAACARQKRSNRSRRPTDDAASKRLSDSRPERLPMCQHSWKVDVSVREDLIAEVRFREQALFDQAIEADQQRVARQGRQALIRGVAVPGRSERKDLPHALTGVREQMDERERAGPRSPMPKRAGSAGRVEEHAARAGKRHGAV